MKQFSELSEADQQKMIKSLEEIMLELLRKSPVVWQREKPKHDAPNAQH